MLRRNRAVPLGGEKEIRSATVSHVASGRGVRIMALPTYSGDRPNRGRVTKLRRDLWRLIELIIRASRRRTLGRYFLAVHTLVVVLVCLPAVQPGAGIVMGMRTFFILAIDLPCARFYSAIIGSAAVRHDSAFLVFTSLVFGGGLYAFIGWGMGRLCVRTRQNPLRFRLRTLFVVAVTFAYLSAVLKAVGTRDAADLTLIFWDLAAVTTCVLLGLYIAFYRLRKTESFRIGVFVTAPLSTMVASATGFVAWHQCETIWGSVLAPLGAMAGAALFSILAGVCFGPVISRQLLRS